LKILQFCTFKQISLNGDEKRIFADSALELISDEKIWGKYDRENTISNVLRFLAILSKVK